MKPHMSGPSIVDGGNTAGAGPASDIAILPLQQAEVAASA